MPLKALMGSPGWHSLRPPVTSNSTLCHWETCHVARTSWLRQRQGLQASSRVSVARSLAAPTVWGLEGGKGTAGKVRELCVWIRKSCALVCHIRAVWPWPVTAPLWPSKPHESSGNHRGVLPPGPDGRRKGSCRDVDSTQEMWVHPGLRAQSEQEGDGRTFPGQRLGLPLLWSRPLPVSLRGSVPVGFRNKSTSSCPPSLPPFTLPSGPVRMN